jgi:hypothetical protein
MATIESTFYRDGNFVPITSGGIITKRTVTFTGATDDAWGNDGGALDGGALFTVTGLVTCKLIGVCSTSLTGDTATIEVGITGATAILQAQDTATGVDAGHIILHNATSATYFIIGEEEAAADNLPIYALNGNDIILTVTTADIEAGVIDYYCIWNPISSDANLVATTD